MWSVFYRGMKTYHFPQGNNIYIKNSMNFFKNKAKFRFLIEYLIKEVTNNPNNERSSFFDFFDNEEYLEEKILANVINGKMGDFIVYNFNGDPKKKYWYHVGSKDSSNAGGLYRVYSSKDLKGLAREYYLDNKNLAKEIPEKMLADGKSPKDSEMFFLYTLAFMRRDGYLIGETLSTPQKNGRFYIFKYKPT